MITEYQITVMLPGHRELTFLVNGTLIVWSDDHYVIVDETGKQNCFPLKHTIIIAK